MLYGAAYYHEYQPYERLDDDIRLMCEAGFTVVRLGESTWASWEPEDGRFELAWMERIIDAMHAAHIKVILGTPTYAIPPWLHRKYPEIMAQNASGVPTPYGGRQNVNFTHPTYLYYAERVIRKLISHFAPHPAVIGYQVDNETGSGALYNPHVFQQFVEYLRKQYGTLDCLNKSWGLTYWSHRLSDWADLWLPDGNTNPGYALEWHRFQASLVTDFLAWQKNLVGEFARSDQFVTQDLQPGHNRSESDTYQIGQIMDVLAVNPYYATQDRMGIPDSSLRTSVPRWLDVEKTGVAFGTWGLYQSAQFAYGSKQSNFLVTELNASSIGESFMNYPSYDGQWRLAAYAYISQGANMIAYWHWHSLHYGNEAYWGGVLGHDLEPGRAYNEIAQIGRELLKAGDILTDLTVDADVALLYSQDSKYALGFQPCLSIPDTDLPNQLSYQTIFDTFYKAFFDARAQTAIVNPQQGFENYPLLVVPALYIAHDLLLKRLVNYVQEGGHLLLTFRSGYADQDNTVRPIRAPGLLREACGLSYQEFSNLAAPLPVRSNVAEFVMSADAYATQWADGLQIEGATPLVYYVHPHFGKFPAIASQQYGKGRITYCGTLPSAELALTLAQWVMQEARVEAVGAELAPSVRAHHARTRKGEKLTFYTNWSWTPHRVSPILPGGRDLMTNEPITSEMPIELGPWDVKVQIR